MSEVSKQTVKNKIHKLEFPGNEVARKDKKEVDYLYIDADEDHVSLQFREKKGDLRVIGENQKNNCLITKLVYVYEGIENESPKSKRHKLIEPYYFCRVCNGKDKLFRCCGLDMIYYLCFTENIEELYDYLAYENDNEYEQLLGFGGDATRFLSWKMQQHMFAKGAIKFGMIDVGYDTENQYVVDYYREKLTMFPFDLRDYIFDNPFSWNIKEATNGFHEYVYKGGAGFGGNYKRYNNGCYLFFAHHLEFFIKTNTINKYKDQIHFRSIRV